MKNRKTLLGWGGIAATIALTISAMALASATGLAKTPSAASLEEDSGGAAVADTAGTSAVVAGAPSSTIDVTLSEWSIAVSATSASAGTITFNIQNTGPAYSHEFIILKTDIAPDGLPTLRDKSLNESGSGITSPGESNPLAVGKKQTITVAMAPGRYVFVDNIVERSLVHWEKKAYATFTVLGASAANSTSPVPAPTTAGASNATAVAAAVPTTDPTSKLKVTGGPIGSTASATMHAAPGASCTIIYVHPSGKTATLKALAPKTTGPDGVVTWTWNIDPGTKPAGQGTVTVVCGTVVATQPITITAAAGTAGG